MRLIILILSLFSFLLFSLFFPHKSYASTLYSQDFKSEYVGYTTSFGLCAPSENGLMCSPTAVGIYNSEFPSARCIVGDFSKNSTGIFGSDLIFSKTNQDLNNVVVVKFRLGENILLRHTRNALLRETWNTRVSTPAGNHTYALCKDGHLFDVYLDGKKVFSQQISDFSGNYVGFTLDPGDRLTDFFVLDNVPYSDRIVPLFKQTDLAWSGNEYDTASTWYPSDPTIGRWGCAVTSAAMILGYHGYDTLPGGRELNPGSLNAWLKSQPDGYIGSGWTNWLAISRLSRIAANENNITDFKALEYSRSSLFPQAVEEGLPAIIEEPGHFFVGTEYDSGVISVHDPFYERTSVNFDHSILSVGKFTPSNTDLSYFLFTYDPSIQLEVFNENGHPVGEQFFQQTIHDPNTFEEFGEEKMMYMLQKPEDGKYKFNFTSNESAEVRSVDGFVYDNAGGVEEIKFPDSLITDETTTFLVEFTKSETDNTPFPEKRVLLSLLLYNVDIAYTNDLMHISTYKVLSSHLKQVEKDLSRGKASHAKKKVESLINKVYKLPGHHINEKLRKVFIADLSLYKAQI